MEFSTHLSAEHSPGQKRFVSLQSYKKKAWLKQVGSSETQECYSEKFGRR
jgi:alpha-D-ribose 1-methylphosphonate 5-triphosphate diphosphatase PhnM